MPVLRVLDASLQDDEALVRTRRHATEAVASTHSSFGYGTIKRATVFPRPGLCNARREFFLPGTSGARPVAPGPDPGGFRVSPSSA